jgi:hypothetical protein
VSNEHAQKNLTAVYCAQVQDLCQSGLALADLGTGVSMLHALAGEEENSKSRSVVMVICGPIPDDLIEAMGQYCQALSQDLKTSGVISTAYEN